MKKVLKITLLSVLVTIVIAGICVWMEFGTRIQGAMSVQKVDDGLYYMEYRGDDGLEGLLAQGGFEDNTQLADYIMRFLSKGHYRPAMSPQKSDFGCSAMTVTTPDGAVLMGRNFDFPSATGVILHTIPDQGYESIATFNVEFFGFGQDYKPEGFDWADCHQEDKLIYAIIRRSKKSTLLAVFNLNNVTQNYSLELEKAKRFDTLLCSDWGSCGGWTPDGKSFFTLNGKTLTGNMPPHSAVLMKLYE